MMRLSSTRSESVNDLYGSQSTANSSAPRNSNIKRNFSLSSLIDFSGVKEKFSKLKSLSFPSVQDEVQTSVNWSGQKIQLEKNNSSESAIANKSALPSSSAFRTNIGGFLKRMSIFSKDAKSFISYKLLLKGLDSYHELPRTNPTEIETALSKLNVLESLIQTMRQANSENPIQAVDDLLKNIRQEKNICSLKKEIMERAGSDYSDANEKSFQQNVDGGAMSEVSRVTYKNGKDGFFKPVDENNSLGATQGAAMGIPNASPLEAGFATRNVLSYEVSKLLPGNLIPETTYATHQGMVGSFQSIARGSSLYQEEMRSIPFNEKNAALIAMCQDERDRPIVESNFKALAISVPAGSSFEVRDNCVYQGARPLEEKEVQALYKKGELSVTAKFISSVDTTIDFSNPSLQKAMTNAHLLDFLTGQVDRNPGNFFYEKKEEGGYALHLIDNDQSFPSKFSDFSPATMEVFYKGCALQELPRLVDQEMAEALLKLDSSKLRSLLAKGGLATQEVDATLDRLAGLQEHIKKIKAGEIPGGKIVTEWNDDTSRQLQEKRDNYIFRSLDDRNGLEEQRKILKEKFLKENVDE